MKQYIMIKQTNKSILKAVSIIKSFDPNNLELSTTEIAKKLGINKSTTYHILETLTGSGILGKNKETKKYRIGLELYISGSLYLNTTDILKAAEPVAKTLNDLTKETVSVGIFDKGYLTIVMREESKHDFRWARHVGSTVPAYASAMGKAFLSELTDAELDRLFPEERLQPITKNTITNKTKLKQDLEMIRETGISYDNQGNADRIYGIASLVRDAHDKTVAAMSIALPVFRIDNTLRPRLAKIIKLGTGLVSYQLGCQNMVNHVRDVEEIRTSWEKNRKDSS